MTVTHQGPFSRELLEPEDCLRMLGSARLARVLISVRCLPAALPVFVQVSGRRVLVASAEEAVIEAARRGDVLAVQLDGTDTDGSTWSVQVTGISTLGDPDSVPDAGSQHRLIEAIRDGATLVDVSVTVVHGERIRWSFPS